MSYQAHETAVIDAGCEIGEGTHIWHFSHIMTGCVIGRACNIGQNVVVSPGVVLGNNVKVQNNVSIYTGVICEDDVFLGPSCVFTNVTNPRSAISRKDQTRKGIASGLEQCRKIARLPRTEVIDRSREGSPGTVGMELEDGLFYLNAGYCGKSVKTLLDIGAEYTSIDQSLADELGVRIFQDSLRMSPASYMKLGILDSLQIGSITLKNEICCVFPDGLAARNREATADSGITRIRAMLGISTLRKLSALTVDVEHGTITFDTGKQPQTGIANFMLKDNIPYLWLELNGIPAMMHWDTGMNAKPRLSGKFYAEHASSLPELGPVRKGSEITAAGAAEYRYHALGGICAKIGSREVILPEVRVVFDTEDMHTAEVPGYDGQMNNIVDVRRIRIDFENMCVTME